MTYTKNKLVGKLEALSADPIERIRLAVAERLRMLTVTDEAIDHFVSAARAAGTPWATILALVDSEAFPGDEPPGRPAASNYLRVHNGKYRQLWKWLGEQAEDEIELTFTEIEQILGFPLPPSSRGHLPHWHGYKGSAVARAIIDAGFKSKNVSLADGTVTLVRTVRD